MRSSRWAGRCDRYASRWPQSIRDERCEPQHLDRENVQSARTEQCAADRRDRQWLPGKEHACVREGPRERDASRPTMDALPSPTAAAHSAMIAAAGGRMTSAASIDAASQVAPVMLSRSWIRSMDPTRRSNMRAAGAESRRAPSTSTATESATVSRVRNVSGDRTPSPQLMGSDAEPRWMSLRTISCRSVSAAGFGSCGGA